MAVTNGVNHVGLSVRDLEGSKGLFQEILGFEVVKAEEGKFAFLSDGTTMITLWPTAEKEADVKTAGLHHLAFSVESAEVLREVEKKLMEKNYRIQFDGMGVREKEGGFIALFFYDPSGIRIELATKEKAQTNDIPIIGGCGDLD